MVGYYCRFIPHFAKLVNPLVFFLQKDTSFLLEEEKDSSFWALQEALAFSPVLSPPNFEKYFFLFTNATNSALGAILDQLNYNKFKHHIT